jgi:hypothetical protein
VQEAEREIRREALFQELNYRVPIDLDLRREQQRFARLCARRDEQPQTLAQQALSLSRRQLLKLCRSHRTPSCRHTVVVLGWRIGLLRA